MDKLIHIGTSGWHYQHWKGRFYPEDMPDQNMLKYYEKKFETAEINNTFYQLPKEKTLLRWRDTVPEDFIFSVKASRYITHMKKLKDPKEPVTNFLDRIKSLGHTLGPILFQLPPRWNCNPARLKSFLQVLPAHYRCTFEFRDQSWFDDQIYQALKDHNAAFCIYHLSGVLSPKEVTADFIYIRLHGPGGPYQGQYTDETLAKWGQIFDTWNKQGKEIYCYFDNDEAGYGAQDALRLQEIVNQ